MLIIIINCNLPALIYRRQERDRLENKWSMATHTKHGTTLRSQMTKENIV